MHARGGGSHPQFLINIRVFEVIMYIIVGLGNPGAQYAQSRHNIGFMAIDRIAQDHSFAPWKRKFQSQISAGQLGDQKVLLVKPQTFMNRSGQAVGEAARFHKVAAQDVMVLHDELDLAPGKCRVKQGGGHAGHNGLRSIHAHIGDSYGRVRLGIGHPGRKEAVASYVLRDFTKGDEAWLWPLLEGISNGAVALAAGDHGRFMNTVSVHTAPPRSSGTVKATAAKAAGKPTPTSKDTRSALDRLIDKFRG